jgi:hypothetical protein
LPYLGAYLQAIAPHRPCSVYGLASSRDRIVHYLGQTRDGVATAVRQHLADARGKRAEFDCSDWLRAERLAGHRILAVMICAEAVWGKTLDAEISRRRKAGDVLYNRVPDLDADTRLTPEVVVTKQARERMSDAAKRRVQRATIPTALATAAA